MNPEKKPNLMNPIFTLLVCALALAVFPRQAQSAEDEFDAAGFFGDWSAFFDEDTCWIGSHPLNATDEAVEDIYMFFSFFHGSSEFEIAIFSDRFTDNIQNATLSSGSDLFELISRDDTLYLFDHDEHPTFWNLFNNSKTTLNLTSKDNEEHVYEFSPYGFISAYQYIVDNCDFKMRRRIYDGSEIEPT